MKPSELQKILQSENKLTLAEIKEIIYQLQQDCFWEIYELGKKEFSVDCAKDSIHDCLDVIKTQQKIQFYQGETNAFYICLDLLNKIGENECQKN